MSVKEIASPLVGRKMVENSKRKMKENTGKFTNLSVLIKPVYPVQSVPTNT